MEEYRKKAGDMDQLLGEVGQGRVRRRLDQFGDLIGLVKWQIVGLIWLPGGRGNCFLSRRGGWW